MPGRSSELWRRPARTRRSGAAGGVAVMGRQGRGSTLALGRVDGARRSQPCCSGGASRCVRSTATVRGYVPGMRRPTCSRSARAEHRPPGGRMAAQPPIAEPSRPTPGPDPDPTTPVDPPLDPAADPVGSETASRLPGVADPDAPGEAGAGGGPSASAPAAPIGASAAAAPIASTTPEPETTDPIASSDPTVSAEAVASPGPDGRPADTRDLPIVMHDVSRRFGDREVLSGIDLTVPRGTILGIIGPSGAGKT